jgi:WD40 repeat protein
MYALEAELDNKLNYLLALYTHMQDMEARMKAAVEATDAVTMNMRGTLFVIETEHLTASSNIFFHALIYSDPEPEFGYYFIDHPFEGFDRIVSAMTGVEISYEGLNDYEWRCIDYNLNFFRLPYPRYMRVFYKRVSWDIGNDFTVSFLFSLQDGRLCSGTLSGVIMIWKTSTHKCEMELLGHTDRIMAIIQLDDGRLCSLSNDRYIKIWDLSSGECVANLRYNREYVNAIIQCSPTRLCIGSNVMQLWDLQTGMRDKTVNIYGVVNSLELLPNGSIACLSWTGMIQIWSDGLVYCVRKIDASAEAFAKLESGHLCTVTSKGLISIWDYLTGAKIKSFRLRLQDIVHSIVVLHDKRICIQTGSNFNDDGTLFICNLDSSECEQEIEVVCRRRCHIQAIQLNDSRLCTACESNITLWG